MASPARPGTAAGGRARSRVTTLPRSQSLTLAAPPAAGPGRSSVAAASAHSASAESP